MIRRVARYGSASLIALAAVAGCSADPAPPERRAITPPDPIVASVVADPSAMAPSAPVPEVVSFDISSASSITVVITKFRPLSPQNYVPGDLVNLDVVPGGGGEQMRREAAEALTAMYSDAAAAGAPFRIRSAYRSFDVQQSVYRSDARAWGQAEADRRVARPGYSEHQTGLAADVYDVPANVLNQSFGDSAAGTWIREYAHKYGYIVSYPEGAEAITGFFYEPWHIRYVGRDVSEAMYEDGMRTLQEFFDVEASPNYG